MSLNLKVTLSSLPNDPKELDTLTRLVERLKAGEEISAKEKAGFLRLLRKKRKNTSSQLDLPGMNTAAIH